MSPGAALPSDITAVVTSARRLYRQCRNAGGEYLEISREVRGLHTVLRHLKYEVQAPESILNRDRSLYAKELAPTIGDCELTFRRLDDLLLKYDRLGIDGGGGKALGKIGFGSGEMDQLGDIRLKLINHESEITDFLDTIQLGESPQMPAALENDSEYLDQVLDKVDKIAARMGQRARSNMTTYDDDDREIWKQFRRELVKEGFSSEVLQQNKDVLRAYIREIDQNGLLEDAPYDQKTTVPLATSERRPDAKAFRPQFPELEYPPPSFDSINAHVEDIRAKEMVMSEDNIKFLPSIKTQRSKPESRHQDSGMKCKSPIAIPASSPNTNIDNREVENISSALITTTELLAPQNYRLDPSPPSSPVESKGFVAFSDDQVPRSMARRPRPTLTLEPTQYGTSSPSQYGTSPHSTSPQSTRNRAASLAPDSQGIEIPLGAKWTRVRRSLISSEVLEHDGRRYEARPEFVAILGVLSRDEIEDLAARSQILREVRREKTLRSGQPPPKPPRPLDDARRKVSFEDRDDEDSSDESDQRDRRGPNRERQSYPPVNLPYHSSKIYSTSPSRTQTAPQQWPVPQYGPTPTWSPPPSSPRPSYHLSPAEAERPRRALPERSERSERSKTREKEKERKSRWGQNLTAAGIGGAAVGLLNVLAEAAEAM